MCRGAPQAERQLKSVQSRNPSESIPQERILSQGKRSPSKYWLIRFLTSTVGQKILMGFTGLGLCGFLVAHLSGNLLMYKAPLLKDGGKAYNEYAHFLHSRELLLPAEIGLFTMIILHIILGFTTAAKNTKARGTEVYAEKQTKQSQGVLFFFPHNVMFATGLVVLLFLVVHLSDMKFELRNQVPSGTASFDHAVRVLKDPISAVIYVVGSLVLGVHLAHGFQSAFRSIGFAHPKYSPFLGKLSIVFAIVIALGFASLPIWFFLQ